ncbi:YtxH domain-containing protein [Alteribacter natronophilus]|uniref:YtxH domain-containing protein n=1 Tax=Alteribacter natronophilus TaxID=2583810 RepID=UPI00110F2090|nr:YtxH domain-containing protein [Alteribacter natronophilus]TMW72211.1 YtxH domain-containing protein [Alteribacter natronophilus]
MSSNQTDQQNYSNQEQQNQSGAQSQEQSDSTQQNDQPMQQHHRSESQNGNVPVQEPSGGFSTGSFFAGAAIGALVASAAAVLSTPKSGKEVRDDIVGKYEETTQKGKDTWAGVVDTSSKRYEELKEKAGEITENITNWTAEKKNEAAEGLRDSADKVAATIEEDEDTEPGDATKILDQPSSEDDTEEEAEESNSEQQEESEEQESEEKEESEEKAGK